MVVANICGVLCDAEAEPDMQVMMAGGSAAPPGGPQRTFFRLAGSPSTSGGAPARLDQVAPRVEPDTYYNTPSYKRLPQTNDRGKQSLRIPLKPGTHVALLLDDNVGAILIALINIYTCNRV